MASELEKVKRYTDSYADAPGDESCLSAWKHGDWIKRYEALAAAAKDTAAAEQRGVLAGKVQAFEEMREEMHATLLELRGQPAFEDYCQAYEIVMDVAEKKRDEALAAAAKDIAAARVQAFEEMRVELHKRADDISDEDEEFGARNAYRMAADIAHIKRDEAAKAGGSEGKP